MEEPCRAPGAARLDRGRRGRGPRRRTRCRQVRAGRPAGGERRRRRCGSTSARPTRSSDRPRTTSGVVRCSSRSTSTPPTGPTTPSSRPPCSPASAATRPCSSAHRFSTRSCRSSCPSPPRIAELEADVRADAIRDLAIQLLATAVESAPRMIVLEDVHWAEFELMGTPPRGRPARARRPAGPVDSTDGRNGASPSSNEPLPNPAPADPARPARRRRRRGPGPAGARGRGPAARRRRVHRRARGGQPVLQRAARLRASGRGPSRRGRPGRPPGGRRDGPPGARRARLGPRRGRRADRRPVALGAAHLEGGQRHRPPVSGRDPHGRPPARGRAALSAEGARAFDRARPDPPRDAGPGPRLPVHPRDHPGGRVRPAHLRPAPSAPPGRRRVVRGARCRTSSRSSRSSPITGAGPA